MINPSPLTYVFHFESGRSESVRLEFDEHMLLTQHSTEEAWTRLDDGRCPHCPLPPGGACPFASAMAPFIHKFDDFYSYEQVRVEVTTPRRVFTAERDLQYGLASLLGLVGSASGCPRLAFFRSMSRLHLPFSNDEEVIYRTFTIHLMRQYLINGTPEQVEVDFQRFLDEYQAAAKVHSGMIERLRGVFPHDAAVNALVVLNTMAQMAPLVIKGRLVEMTPAFIAATSV